MLLRQTGWGLFLLFGIPCAWSQSALRQAIQGDQAAEVRVEARASSVEGLTEDEIKAGPITFSIAASYSLEFNDNVNTASTDTEADLIHLPVVTIGFNAPISEQSDLTFDIGIGYQIYTRNSGLSRFYISPGSELAWDIQIEDLFLTLYNQTEYTQDIASEAALTGQATYPRFDNTIGMRGTYLPGKMILSAGYGYQITVVDDSSFSYLDANSHLIFGRGGYFFSPEVEGGVEVSGTLTDFRQNVNPDGTVGSLGPYLEWRPDPALNVALRGGLTYLDNEASTLQPAANKTTYYVGLDGRHQLTEFIGHGLAVYRGARTGVELGSSFIEETTVNYDLTWVARDPLELGLTLGYEHGEQPVTLVGATDETFDQFRVGVGASYQVREKLSCRLSYEFIIRESNIDGRDYTQNRIILGASYQFR